MRQSETYGRTPSAMPIDELVLTVGSRNHPERLQHSLVGNGGRKPTYVADFFANSCVDDQNILWI
jgi:hypothetical protein